MLSVSLFDNDFIAPAIKTKKPQVYHLQLFSRCYLRFSLLLITVEEIMSFELFALLRITF